MKPFCYSILLALLITSCSKSADVLPQNQSQSANASSKFKMTNLNLQIEPRISKGLRGDLTDVGFTVQNRPYHPLVKGRLQCSVDSASLVSCVGIADLGSLPATSYRIIVYTNENFGKEALACDYFAFNKETQLNLTINPSSSGECVLAQLEADTGFSENEIRKRIKHMLNADDSDDFDLETTLYDVFRYYNYNSKDDWDKSWNILLDAIKTNQPLPKKQKSMINGSGRSIQ